MKLELKEPDVDEQVVDFGSIRVRAYLKDGKETLIITAINNRDFILCMPTSANQIVISAGNSLL